MNDYEDFYPTPEPPESDPSGIPETPEIPESPEIPETPASSESTEAPEEPQDSPYGTPPPSVFYSDPSAAPPPRPVYNPMPETPPQKPVTMNRRIYTMSAVIAALVFLLCVYCIGSDMLHGALDTEVPGSVTVELKTQKKPDLDPDDENVNPDGTYTVRGVAELVKPSIVEVYCYSSTEHRESTLEGTGSGIIISEDGYIITNAHVVQGESFTVVLDDDEEKEYTAKLVGSDAKTDLAVLKINAGKRLQAVTLGDSDETYVGEDVLAIGNPAGLTNSVTKGIVSAIGRQVRAESNSFRMECIQTDAAISPGNSGGALVNMYGQVIGITSSKYASSYSSTYEGLGFAISINQALPVVTDLMEVGYVEGRFRVGITLMSCASEAVQDEFAARYKADMPAALKKGIWISDVSEDCDIASTELRADDFNLEVEGTPVNSYDEVIAALEGFKGGDTVKAKCARYENGEITYFDIEFKLEEDTSGNF